MQKADLYRDEAGAELYDIAFDWRRNEEADFTEMCLQAFSKKTARSVLDVACGGGQFLLEMQQRGWRVAGIDISPHMITRAQARLTGDCALEVACMSRFTLTGVFDIATCWLDSLTYLLTNEDIIRHLRRVARVVRDGGLYLLDIGFGRWADPMWREPEADWQPDFSNGWSASRGVLEVYHDGCDGPPCDCVSHVSTEHMYFRATDLASGSVTEYFYKAPKRALHPQEFAALVSASDMFEVVSWFSGSLKLSETLESNGGRGRGLVLLRRRSQ